MQVRPFFSLVKYTLFVAVFVSGASTQAGGWATVVLKELPEIAVRDKPLRVSFSIKQHGVSPLTALKPYVVAKNRSTGELLRFRVNELQHGLYESELNFPAAGTWDWVIKTTWPGPPQMPQIEVIDSPDISVREITKYQRGARLFVAKGCITCHKNSRVHLDNAQSFHTASDLTHYQASEQFLYLWLSNPKEVKPNTRMPDPKLNEDDISALTALFIRSNT